MYGFWVLEQHGTLKMIWFDMLSFAKFHEKIILQTNFDQNCRNVSVVLTFLVLTPCLDKEIFKYQNIRRTQLRLYELWQVLFIQGDISNTCKDIYASPTGRNMMRNDAIRAAHRPPVRRVIAEVTLTHILVSFRHKRITRRKRVGPFKPSLLHPPAAVHHFDWRLRGGLWRADESKKPISASEATAAVLCSPAHLPPPPPALLLASCRPSSLLCLQPIKRGHCLMEEMHCLQGPERSLCLSIRLSARPSVCLSVWLLLKHQVQHTGTCHWEQQQRLEASLRHL